LVGFLHLVVDGVEGGVLVEETAEDFLLGGEEILWMGAQGGEVSPVMFHVRNELANKIHEVLLDEANDVEAVCDDSGPGEVSLDQRAIGTAQIHADEADVFFAFEGGEVGVKVLRVTAFDDVEDAVIAQVAEGCGEPCSPLVAGPFSVDGVFVDAEDGRADSVGVFPGFACGVFVVEAFDRGMADAFASGQNASGNAIAVTLVDGLSEGFGGLAIGFDAREFRKERPVTATAFKALGVDFEEDRPAEAVEVTHRAQVGALAVDLQAPGLATLVGGAFRSTARAGGTSHRMPREMQHRMMPMLLEAL
jgi:hypothetical protein